MQSHCTAPRPIESGEILIYKYQAFGSKNYWLGSGSNLMAALTLLSESCSSSFVKLTVFGVLATGVMLIGRSRSVTSKSD